MHLELNRPEVLEEPVLEGENEADALGTSFNGSVIREGGLFRMWYQAYPSIWDGTDDSAFVGCVESDDGLTWRRPGYGLIEVAGSKQNQLTNLPFHCPSVFVDPDADSEQRFRAFGFSHKGQIGKDYPQKVNRWGYFTACSTDGIRWDIESPEPTWPGGDVITSTWDSYADHARIMLKRGFFKGGIRRRAFSEASWKNGEASEALRVLVPDDYDDVRARQAGFFSADYYGLGIYPTSGATFGFLWNFRHMPSEQGRGLYGRVDVSVVYQLAGGGCWQHVPGRPDWLSTADAPEWARGAIYTASAPLEVGDETWMYFSGTEGWHGWYGEGVKSDEWREKKQLSSIGLARWKRNRILGYRSELRDTIELIPRKAEEEAKANKMMTESHTHIHFIFLFLISPSFKVKPYI